MEGEKKSQDSSWAEKKAGENTGNFFINWKNKIIGSREEPVIMQRNEKVITWVIVAVGILAIFLGVKSFSDNIFYPTWLRIGDSNSTVSTLDNNQISGANPLDLLNNDNNGSNGSFAPKVSTTLDGVPQQGSAPDLASSGLTVAQLRQGMIDSGMAKADVDQMTDQQIEALYQQAQASALDPANNPTTANDLLSLAGQSSSTPAASPSSNGAITSLDQLKNMPISQFRQLLLSSPDLTTISRDILNKMSDPDLQKLLDQQLASTTSAN